jgi:chromosome segregation ATPase
MGNWINLISLSIGLLSFLSGGILWYRGSIEKRYAAERDFQHLKKNQEGIAVLLTQMDDSLDDMQREEDALLEEFRKLAQSYSELNRSYIEMRTLVMAMHNRMEAIAARIDSSTSGWTKRD